MYIQGSCQEINKATIRFRVIPFYIFNGRQMQIIDTASHLV